MTAKEQATLAPPVNGHNYDFAQRSEYIANYYARRKELDDAKAAVMAKRKTEDNAHRALVNQNQAMIKGLSIDIEDADEGYSVYLRRQAIANAESEKEREAAEARLDLHTANRAECIAVATGVEVGQLDFHKIMEAGAHARTVVAKLDATPKIKVTGGAKTASGTKPPASH